MIGEQDTKGNRKIYYDKDKMDVIELDPSKHYILVVDGEKLDYGNQVRLHDTFNSKPFWAGGQKQAPYIVLTIRGKDGAVTIIDEGSEEYKYYKRPLDMKEIDAMAGIQNNETA